MPKLRRLSGGDLVHTFARFGFRQFSQRGSHVKLRRVLANGVRENLTVPLHDELDRGSKPSIAKQLATSRKPTCAHTSIRTEVRSPPLPSRLSMAPHGIAFDARMHSVVHSVFTPVVPTHPVCSGSQSRIA